MITFILYLLFELTAKQQLYLAKKLFPQCQTIGVIAVKDQSQERAAELAKNSPYYGLRVEVEIVKKSIELPKGLQALLDKKIDLLWIFEDSVNGDPMALRFLVTKTQETKIPIICQSEKQLQFGATVLFTINEEGQAIVKARKAALEALKLELSGAEELQIKLVE